MWIKGVHDARVHAISTPTNTQMGHTLQVSSIWWSGLDSLLQVVLIASREALDDASVHGGNISRTAVGQWYKSSHQISHHSS